MLVFVTTSLPDNDLGEMAKSSPFCNTCSCPASDLLITQLSVLIALCSLMIYGFFPFFPNHIEIISLFTFGGV